MVYLFTTDEGLWELDLRTVIPRKISTHGTIAPKSVVASFDSMIWVDGNAVWSLTQGGENINRISDPVVKFLQAITSANKTKLSAGISQDGVYKLWIGDVTVEGISYSDAVLVYDIEESRRVGRHVWRIDELGFAVTHWTTWTDSTNTPKFYYSKAGTTNVYEDEAAHGGASIELSWDSKDYTVVNEKDDASIVETYIWYKPQSVTIPLTLRARVDMGISRDIGSYNLPSTAETAKLVYKSESLNIVKLMITAKDFRGRTMSIGMSSTSNVETIIYKISVYRNKGESDFKPLGTV
jgi:hypothetical protein